MFPSSNHGYRGPTTREALLEALRDPDAYYTREAERIYQMLR